MCRLVIIVIMRAVLVLLGSIINKKCQVDYYYLGLPLGTVDWVAIVTAPSDEIHSISFISFQDEDGRGLGKKSHLFIDLFNANHGSLCCCIIVKERFAHVKQWHNSPGFCSIIRSLQVQILAVP